MSTPLRAGEQLASTVCTTRVVVVRAPSGGAVTLECGGGPMIAATGSRPTGGPVKDAVTMLGKRYVNDENLPIYQCFTAAGTASGSVQRGTFCADGSSLTDPDGAGPRLAPAFTPGTLTQVYGASAPGYDLVDLDVRLNMEQWGLGKNYLQLNVSNLFDVLYVGGFGGSSNRFSVPFVQIGAPRSATLSLVVGI